MPEPISPNLDRFAWMQFHCKWKPETGYVLAIAEESEKEITSGSFKLHLPESYQQKLKPHIARVFRENEEQAPTIGNPVWEGKKIFFATGNEYTLELEEEGKKMSFYILPIHSILMSIDEAPADSAVATA